MPPYNSLVPTDEGSPTHAGCVATAVAQIMYYWGHDYTYDGYTFDWDLMRQHISYKYGEKCEQAYAMIAELFLKLGLEENLEMTYGKDSSHASDYNVPRTFENFGYTSGGDIESYDFDDLYNAVLAGPVYVSGWTTSVTFGKGHAWVVDEVLTRRRIRYTHVEGVGITQQDTQYQHLVHCNFGWSGTSNGYYYSGTFAIRNPVIQDPNTTIRPEDYNYQYRKLMNTSIYNIE